MNTIYFCILVKQKGSKYIEQLISLPEPNETDSQLPIGPKSTQTLSKKLKDLMFLTADFNNFIVS